MLEKQITFPDYRGRMITETFYFNLNKPELAELALSRNGGMEEYIKEIIDAKDNAALLETFKRIIQMSVGRLSENGRRFEKSQDITDDFMQTEAYTELFMELVQNADAAAEFIKGIVPEDMMEKLDERNREYSEKELMAMSDEEFDRVVGKDPKKMTRDQLQVAMARRGRRAA